MSAKPVGSGKADYEKRTCVPLVVELDDDVEVEVTVSVVDESEEVLVIVTAFVVESVAAVDESVDAVDEVGAREVVEAGEALVVDAPDGRVVVEEAGTAVVNELVWDAEEEVPVVAKEGLVDAVLELDGGRGEEEEEAVEDDGEGNEESPWVV